MTTQQSTYRPLLYSTLGFEKLFNDVEKIIKPGNQKTPTSFPPHNIIKLNEHKYLVELAIAGFSQEEVEITLNDGQLLIRGERLDKDGDIVYLHRGIGARSFVKTLTLADTVEVVGAEYKDGILRIGLENIIPESKKPRTIQIGNLPDFDTKQLLQE